MLKRIVPLVGAAVAAITLTAAVATTAVAQVPWDHPELIFHTVLTSAATSVTIDEIPNSHDTLRLVMRGQSTDTNTAVNYSFVMAQLNANTSNYSWGYTYWQYASAAGTAQSYNQNSGGLIGYVPDSAATTDAEGSSSIICTWTGYSQATWDHIALCDHNTSYFNSSAGLARGIGSMIWRPGSPAAINSVMLYLADSSQFDVGTIIDLYLE